MLNITNNDLHRLIEESSNTDAEKAEFLEKLKSATKADLVTNCVEIILANGDRILLRGVKIEKVFNNRF